MYLCTSTHTHCGSAVTSSHPTTIKALDDRHSFVQFNQRGVALDRDVVILIEQAEPFATRALLVHNVFFYSTLNRLLVFVCQELDEENNSVGMQLTFVPPPLSNTDEDAMELKNEFVFIVDRFA